MPALENPVFAVQVKSANDTNILQAIREAHELDQEDVEITLGIKMQDELERESSVSTGCPLLVSLDLWRGTRFLIQACCQDSNVTLDSQDIQQHSTYCSAAFSLLLQQPKYKKQVVTSLHAHTCMHRQT